MTAMVWPTGITAPSCAVTSRRMPDSGASISVVILSVSISTSGSPFCTRSPGAFNQRRIFPFSWASSRAGMMTLVGIGRGPQAFLQSTLAASYTDFSVGTVRSSSTGENGTGTSMAPMRLTGASRW